MVSKFIISIITAQIFTTELLHNFLPFRHIHILNYIKIFVLNLLLYIILNLIESIYYSSYFIAIVGLLLCVINKLVYRLPMHIFYYYMEFINLYFSFSMLYSVNVIVRLQDTALEMIYNFGGLLIVADLHNYLVFLFNPKIKLHIVTYDKKILAKETENFKNGIKCNNNTVDDDEDDDDNNINNNEKKKRKMSNIKKNNDNDINLDNNEISEDDVEDNGTVQNEDKIEKKENVYVEINNVETEENLKEFDINEDKEDDENLIKLNQFTDNDIKNMTKNEKKLYNLVNILLNDRKKQKIKEKQEEESEKREEHRFIVKKDVERKVILFVTIFVFIYLNVPVYLF